MNNSNLDKKTLNDLMQTMQEMQQSMHVIQKELVATEITGVAGGGLVKVTMNGTFIAKRIFIDPSLLQGDQQLMEDLLVAAINDATRQIEKISQDKLTHLSQAE